MAQELEVKFYLQDRPAMVERIQAAGAVLVQPRVFEKNLRFDTPDGSLTKNQRVLRLRMDTRARLTYKGPDRLEQENGKRQPDSVSQRQEIEFGVDDFDAAWEMLDALGYEVSVLYEKYRTTYHLANVEIVVDEMPYGDFLEIEGPDAGSIRQAAERLGLKWDARCTTSYMALFNHLRAGGLEAEHLTFKLLEGKTYTAADFDLQAGDAA